MLPQMSHHTVSIVLPCYNEEENIELAVQDVLSWMRKNGIQGQVIVVNDGSKDRSAEVLQKLQAKEPSLMVLTHPKNQGYGLAIRTGLDAATTDIVGFMDSDLQFHADDLSLLLPHVDEAAFVTGRRRHRADSFLRNSFGKVLGLMNLIVFGLYVRDVNCGMKIFRRDIWSKIRPVHGVEKLFNTEIFLRLKREHIPWITIDVPHYPRLLGKPTGGSVRVIARMFKELMDLRRKINKK